MGHLSQMEWKQKLGLWSDVVELACQQLHELLSHCDNFQESLRNDRTLFQKCSHFMKVLLHSLIRISDREYTILRLKATIQQDHPLLEAWATCKYLIWTINRGSLNEDAHAHVLPIMDFRIVAAESLLRYAYQAEISQSERDQWRYAAYKEIKEASEAYCRLQTSQSLTSSQSGTVKLTQTVLVYVKNLLIYVLKEELYIFSLMLENQELTEQIMQFLHSHSADPNSITGNPFAILVDFISNLTWKGPVVDLPEFINVWQPENYEYPRPSGVHVASEVAEEVLIVDHRSFCRRTECPGGSSTNANMKQQLRGNFQQDDANIETPETNIQTFDEIVSERHWNMVTAATEDQANVMAAAGTEARTDVMAAAAGTEARTDVMAAAAGTEARTDVMAAENEDRADVMAAAGTEARTDVMAAATEDHADVIAAAGTEARTDMMAAGTEARTDVIAAGTEARTDVMAAGAGDYGDVMAAGAEDQGDVMAAGTEARTDVMAAGTEARTDVMAAGAGDHGDVMAAAGTEARTDVIAAGAEDQGDVMAAGAEDHGDVIAVETQHRTDVMTADDVMAGDVERQQLTSRPRRYDPNPSQSQDTSDSQSWIVVDLPSSTYAVDYRTTLKHALGVMKDEDVVNLWVKQPRNRTRLREIAANRRILNSNLESGTCYNAVRWLYRVHDNSWVYRRTVIEIQDELKIASNQKGTFRDIMSLRFGVMFQTTQIEAVSVVAKRYRNQREIRSYLNDVRTQEVAKYYVKLYNQALDRYLPQDGEGDRLVILPVSHMQILSDLRDGEILDYINIEQKWHGTDFTKFTNNFRYFNKYVQKKFMNLLTAFSHFTSHVTEHRLMVSDLQGWLPVGDQTAVVLTDPAINCATAFDFYSTANIGRRGIVAFWTWQHPRCNGTCKALGLERPKQFPEIVKKNATTKSKTV